MNIIIFNCFLFSIFLPSNKIVTSKNMISKIVSKSSSISHRIKFHKRETLNLNEEDSSYLVKMIKTLIKRNQLKMSPEITHSNKNSTFINMPVIQLVVINNQTNTLQESYEENKLKIDQTKSNIFSFLSVFACLLVKKNF